MFPEATSSRSFELKGFKSGAVRMAQAAEVPVVPLVIWGSQRVWTKGYPKRLGRTNVPITLSVGEQIPVGRTSDAEAINTQVRARMNDLLDAAQQAYPTVPTRELKYLPARLGSCAPSLEDATRLDAEAAVPRAARRTRPGGRPVSGHAPGSTCRPARPAAPPVYPLVRGGHGMGGRWQIRVTPTAGDHIRNPPRQLD